MLSYEDCIGLSDLEHDEAAAIAEHERMPVMAAIGKGVHFLSQPWGDAAIRQIVWDNLCRARREGRMALIPHLRIIFRQTCDRRPNPTDRRSACGRETHPLWNA